MKTGFRTSAWLGKKHELANSFRRDLPAAPRRAADPVAARRRRWRAQCALVRAVDHFGHFRHLTRDAVAFRSTAGRIPVRREACLAGYRHRLSHGYRRHLAALRDPHHRADADLHYRELAAGADARARIYDRVLGARDLDDRHLLRARSRAVLSVL